MRSQPHRLIDDPDYLAAQIDCLRSLIITVASATMDRDDFRTGALAALERLRVATLNMPVNELRLAAIDDAEAVVNALTE